MNYEEVIKEIERVKNAIACSNSEYFKRDYKKYLKKLDKKVKSIKYNKNK